MKFFFAIDVGNTDINIALILNYKIHKKYRVKTVDFIKRKNINLLFKPFISIVKKQILNNKIFCVVSSVVDEINNSLKKIIYSFLKTKPLFISDNLKMLNIKINIRNKRELGSDRIANVIAVKKIYKYPAIVVDFGTATTFDIIDNKGNYDGGLITPGINLSLETLYKKTSKLPLVNLKKKKEIIGKTSISAIENGIYWGYVGLVTFLINKIKKKFNNNIFCISTGGLAKIISSEIREIKKVDENLTILGLIEFFKLNYSEQNKQYN